MYISNGPQSMPASARASLPFYVVLGFLHSAYCEPMCPGRAVTGPQSRCYILDYLKDGWTSNTTRDEQFAYARKTCSLNYGGDLASIHDRETNMVIASLIRKQSSNYIDSEFALVGASLKNPGGEMYDSSAWSWIDGTRLDYANWEIGQCLARVFSLRYAVVKDKAWRESAWLGNRLEGAGVGVSSPRRSTRAVHVVYTLGSPYASNVGQPVAYMGQNGTWCNKSRLLSLFACEFQPTSNVERCPNGTLFGTGNNCYWVENAFNSSEGRSYSDAEISCKRGGGHLASIHDLQTNQMITRSTYASGGAVLIGASRTGGQWRWSDGSLFSFTHWDPGNFV